MHKTPQNLYIRMLSFRNHTDPNRNAMKHWRLSCVFLLTIGLLFASCSGGDSGKDGADVLRPASGGRYYGGIFRLNESEYIKSLFPLNIIDIFSYRVACQIYEGLFKFDPKTLKLVNGLVDTYEVDATNTVYTFKLKQNVYFHDDECFPNGKGRKMTAADVVYCFNLICTQDRNNQSFNLFEGIVKGASEHFAQTASGSKPEGGVEGIKALDDYTLQVTLNKPNSMFLYNLARPGAFIFPKEAYEKYGVEMRIKSVGTGPFKLASVDEDISLILKRNDNYHGTDEFGNKLPFLDAISILFLKDKRTELLQFKMGNLDMMYRLPTDQILEILDPSASTEEGGYSQYELQREPEMSTQFLTFNTQSKTFANPNVRKAFSFAIDRIKILDYVLNGEGYEIGKYGITPPSFSDYNISKIRGYDFNIDSAKYYLRKAGYPNGQGFPKIVLDLNAEGERYTNVAVEVQKQLKDNLNIEVELSMSVFSQITEKSLSGKYELLRHTWIADYPSPENFLWAFYGKTLPQNPEDKSYPNISRYNNPKFDEMYEKALNAANEKEAFEYFMKAEQIMIQDAPVLVLWYDEGYRLLQSYVKNFPSNAMQYRDFSAVYLSPRTESNTKPAAN